MAKSKELIPPKESTEKNPSAVALGRLGGKQTAKRGTEYFRKIAAKRKHFRGGRPPRPSV